MAIETKPFDASKYFKTPEDQEYLLNDAIASGDARYIAHALGIVARASGMTELQNETGMKRQQLYRALSAKGNPTLATVMKVLKPLGLQLQIVKAAST